MSLDFVVLDQNGLPEKIVSLGVDLHYELITEASNYGLSGFQDFADYYEDAEIAVGDLPDLDEQVQKLSIQIDSVDLRKFLSDLSELIAYAITNGKVLHVIAD